MWGRMSDHVGSPGSLDLGGRTGKLITLGIVD